MKLGEFISDYREKHNMSKRAFASMVGMSVQQISNIENGTGNDGKPMTSTMKTYRKIASGIGMSERDFLSMLNDDVLINHDSNTKLREELLSSEIRELLTVALDAPESDIREATEMLRKWKERSQ